MILHARPRAAFTLIEILVILTIIALLAALTTSAVFRLQESSRETNTNTHLNKIQMELEKQWKAKVALISKEEPPPYILELTKDANGVQDRNRANAMHKALRLRQEFPQSFSELVPPPMQPINQQLYQYPVKASFRTALRAPLAQETTPEAQSAALLYLSLSQGAGGSTTDADSIARTKPMDYPQQNNAPAVQLKVFVDEWGTHIAFRRWADDDMTDVLEDLNRQPLAPMTAPVPRPQGFILKNDPVDPDGRFQTPWFTPQNGPAYRQIALNILATPKMQNPFDGQNRGPFVFSAGKNKLFRVPNQNPPPPDFAETNLDNLYSYRIATTGRGN